MSTTLPGENELENLITEQAATKAQRVAQLRADFAKIGEGNTPPATEKATPATPSEPKSRVSGAKLDPMLRFDRSTVEFQHEGLLRELVEKSPLSTHLAQEDMPTPPEGSAPINPDQAEVFLEEYIINKLNWEEQPRGILMNDMPVQAAARLLAMPNEAAVELYNQ